MLSGTLVLGLGLLLAAPALASDKPPLDIPELSAGIRRVEEGDLEGALAPLEAAVRRLGQVQAPAAQQARAHLYLALAHLGLGDEERARADMREVWRLDPDLQLDPRAYAPRVLALHEETRPPTAARRKGGSRVPLLAGLGAAGAVAGVALAGGGGTPPASAPAPAPPPPGPVTVHLFNCDDECNAYVNDQPVLSVGLAKES